MSRFLLLLLLAMPAAAFEPRLGPELAVSPTNFSDTSTTKEEVHVAAGKTELLALWSESRYGVQAILGARVSADGELLDRPARLILTNVELMGLAWNGRQYVFVTRKVIGVVGYDTVYEHRSWRLDPDLTLHGPAVLERSGKLFHDDRGRVIMTISCGDQTCLAHLDENGAVTRSDPIGNYDYTVIGAATRGDSWDLVVREGFGTVRWITVDPRNMVIRNKIIFNDGGLVDTAVAFSSGEIALAWTIKIGGGSTRFGYTRIDRVTERVTSVPGESAGGSQEPGAAIHGGLAAVWNGSAFVFAWTRFDGKFTHELRSVSMDGSPVTVGRSEDFAIYARHLPQLASNGSRSLLVWRSSVATVANVAARAFASSAELQVPEEPLLLSAGPAEQIDGRAAANRHGVFAAWREWHDGRYRVVGRFRRLNGNATAALDVSDTPDNALAIEVAATDDVFAVTWRETELRWAEGSFWDRVHIASRVMLRRYDERGVPIDAAPVQIDSDRWRFAPSISATNGAFVLTWSGDRWVYTARVDARGPVAPAAKQVGIGDPTRSVNVPAPDGALAFWAEQIGTEPITIWSRPLAADGAPAGTATKWLTSPSLGRAFDFAVASNHEHVLIAVAKKTATDRECLVLHRFTFDGTLLDVGGETVQCRPSNVHAAAITPSVIWDGERWWVSYESSAYAVGTDGNVLGELPLGGTQASLFLSPEGPAAIYTRTIPGVSMRLVSRSILTGNGRRRSVGH